MRHGWHAEAGGSEPGLRFALSENLDSVSSATYSVPERFAPMARLSWMEE